MQFYRCSLPFLVLHRQPSTIGLAKLLNDLHIGGLIEDNAKTANPVASRAYRSVEARQHNHVGHRHSHQSNDLTGHEEYLLKSPHSTDDPQPSTPSDCLDYQFYLNQVKTDKNGKSYLNKRDLRKMAPIFVQQILSGACEQVEKPTKRSKPNHVRSDGHDHEHHHRASSMRSENKDEMISAEKWESMLNPQCYVTFQTNFVFPSLLVLVLIRSGDQFDIDCRSTYDSYTGNQTVQSFDQSPYWTGVRFHDWRFIAPSHPNRAGPSRAQ